MSIVFGIAAISGALSFFYAKQIISNAGGVSNAIVGVGTGYWLWIASMALAIISAITRLVEGSGRSAE